MKRPHEGFAIFRPDPEYDADWLLHAGSVARGANLLVAAPPDPFVYTSRSHGTRVKAVWRAHQVGLARTPRATVAKQHPTANRELALGSQ